MSVQLDTFIRNVPDFPKPGIQFKDITPLLADRNALDHAVACLHDKIAGESIDLVAGIESRGFIFGIELASKLGTGFVPIRKPGKLPYKTYSQSYDLEYGTDALEIHQDAIHSGQKVLIVDDLLATGGTAQASTELITKCGGDIVACLFLIELAFLDGRKRLANHRVESVLSY